MLPRLLTTLLLLLSSGCRDSKESPQNPLRSSSSAPAPEPEKHNPYVPDTTKERSRRQPPPSKQAATPRPDGGTATARSTDHLRQELRKLDEAAQKQAQEFERLAN